MIRVRFPGWLRLAHVFNIFYITLMMRSGIQILVSLPKLYWKDDGLADSEWLRCTRKLFLPGLGRCRVQAGPRWPRRRTRLNRRPGR